MSDVFWMGFFSLCTAALAACLAYVFNERTATRQTARSERHSAQEWERSESRRKAQEARDEAHRQEDYRRSDARHEEELARQEAHRREARQIELLRDFGVHALQSHASMLRLLQRSGTERSAISAQDSPTISAVHAYTAALLGLTDVYPLAQVYYRATVRLEVAIVRGGDDGAIAEAKGWNEAFENLQKEVARTTGVIPTP